jgi:acyl-CoA synthetase
VRDRHRRLSYAELVAAVDRLAAHLAGRGIRPGHRVAVWLPSRGETAIALLACSRNGYVCCPSLHRDHTVGEIVALVDRMRAAALIAQPDYGADADRHDVFAELANRDFLRCAWRIGPADAAPFGELPGPALEIEARGDANQVMYLPFTSGTTGEPKGVMHSDNTLLATARMIARDWRLERAVLYTLSPLSHNLGLGALVTALAGGGELVVHDLRSGGSLIARLQETGAKFLFWCADSCDRPAHRDPSPRRAACRRRARLPDLWRRPASASRCRPDAVRYRAAERLRHDGNLLAPIYAAR